MNSPKLSRRVVLRSIAASSILGPTLIPGRAHAAEFGVKFAHDFDSDHPIHIRTVEAAKRILERSSGRMELSVFPNNQLGSQTDIISQVRSGGVELIATSAGILGSFIPIAAISGIGFAFPGYQEVWRAMDGPLGQFIASEIQKSGLFAFPNVYDNGFRHMASISKPITSPEDLKGFQDAGADKPALDQSVHGFGGFPDEHQFQ